MGGTNAYARLAWPGVDVAIIIPQSGLKGDDGLQIPLVCHTRTEHRRKYTDDVSFPLMWRSVSFLAADGDPLGSRRRLLATYDLLSVSHV